MLGESLDKDAHMEKDCKDFQHQLKAFSNTITKVYSDPIKTELNTRMENTFTEANKMVSGNKETEQSKKLLQNLKLNKNRDKLTSRISLKKLAMVKNEFQLNPEDRNYHMINRVLEDLKFFSSFPENVRTSLIRIGQWREYEAEQVIFKQGDESYSFFVVVKGSVVINCVKEELGFIPLDYKVAYDGDYFGEWIQFEESVTMNTEVLKELNKQRTTCRAMEKTYVLEISKQENNRIINDGMQGLYERRI